MKPKAWRPPSTVFHAITHVWGREYLDLFLNLCIPNQLAPGNVPALPLGSRYRILTRSTDVDELDAHPNLRALRAVIPVDIVAMEGLHRAITPTHWHEQMIACHQHALDQAVEANAAVIFLSADVILADSVFTAVLRRHREGYRAVAVTGLRLSRESFLTWLERARPRLDVLPPRDLVRIALPHLHPHTQSMFVDADPFSQFPIGIFWRIGNDGLLARFMHLHPLMVDPMVRKPLRGTIDARYLSEACPDFSRVHVVTDSDELQLFELTPYERAVVPASGRGGSSLRSAIVAAQCDELQIRNWRQHTIRLHVGDFDERWKAAATASDAFVRRVLWLRSFGRSARRCFLLAARGRKQFDRYRRKLRRRLPHIRLKQVMRPVRVASHHSARILRRGRRRLRRSLGTLV